MGRGPAACIAFSRAKKAALSLSGSAAFLAGGFLATGSGFYSSSSTLSKIGIYSFFFGITGAGFDSYSSSLSKIEAFVSLVAPRAKGFASRSSLGLGVRSLGLNPPPSLLRRFAAFFACYRLDASAGAFAVLAAAGLATLAGG